MPASPFFHPRARDPTYNRRTFTPDQMAAMEMEQDLFRRLEQLNAIGASLSNERNLSRLLENILIAAKNITRADGGTLYLLADDDLSLRFEIMRTDSLGIALGGTTGNPIKLPNLQLANEEGQPNLALMATYAAIKGETINIPDVYSDADHFDFSGTHKFDQMTGYRSQSFLTVPMKNHENVVIGVLQLINATDPESGQTVPFSAAEEGLAESLASQAAVALANRQLIMQQEALFESFIDLIDTAIDEKSPYTGGHCQRVPALTMMLADAVSQTKEGPLAGFRMDDHDRYELKIAGLLHDCGKVTTPVHVVDKATKLQTLYDRIETVDTRFEVLKRDAEIAMLRQQVTLRDAKDATAEAALQQTFEQTVVALDDERAFLRRSNKGGEAMKPEDQQRVRDIGSQRRWRNPEGEDVPFLTDDETENLTIRAGTLTEAERQIINHHIVATIKMLEQLPWPRHLVNVPEYAGGHHERMDGKGYPRGLKRHEMSLQARMMGIADIFEALTASDRPYKNAMKLSQAMSILANFSRNNHIDPDLFEVFVKQKVYAKYAAEFLVPEQVDAVDETAVLANAVPQTHIPAHAPH